MCPQAALQHIRSLQNAPTIVLLLLAAMFRSLQHATQGQWGLSGPLKHGRRRDFRWLCSATHRIRPHKYSGAHTLRFRRPALCHKCPTTTRVAGDLARCERCALPGFAGLKTNVAHHATIPGSTPLALLDAAAIPSWTLPWPQRARTAWTEQHEQRECDIYDVHHRHALKRVVQAW